MRKSAIRHLLLFLVPSIFAVQLIASTTAMAQSGAANWPMGTELVVHPGVPFVWIRNTPSSNGAVRLTIFPRWPVKTASAQPVWDGVQWWWFITTRTLNDARTVTGWVEQKSLLARLLPGTAFPSPTPLVAPSDNPPPTWAPGTVLYIKRAIPFVWLRTAPNSYAAIVQTFQGRNVSLIFSYTRWDGVQWWASVNTQGVVPLYGWIEVNSLESATPMPTDVPTATDAAFNAPPTVTIGCSQTTIEVHGPRISAPLAPFMRSQVVRLEDNTVLAVRDVPLPDDPPYIIVLTYPTQPAGSRLNVAMFLWNGTSNAGPAAIYGGACH